MSILDKRITDEFSDENKYVKIYLSIMSRAISENRIKGIKYYYEKHHILPSSLFPEFENSHAWNYVLLTAREHYLAHYLLWKIYQKNGKLESMNKMIMAMLMMRAVNHQQQRFNSRLYARLKLSYEHDEATKKKMSSKKKNKVIVLQGDNRVWVDKDIFDNDPSMVGHTHRMVSAKRKDTGEHIFVTQDIFDNDANLVGVNEGVKRTTSFRQNLSILNSGKNSTTAKKINVYDDKDNLILETHGDFEKRCLEVDLPFRVFRKSYQNNCKINYKDGCSITKAQKNGNLKYQGWYAKII